MCKLTSVISLRTTGSHRFVLMRHGRNGKSFHVPALATSLREGGDRDRFFSAARAPPEPDLCVDTARVLRVHQQAAAVLSDAQEDPEVVQGPMQGGSIVWQRLAGRSCTRQRQGSCSRDCSVARVFRQRLFASTIA